jgi:hypothetical protein
MANEILSLILKTGHLPENGKSDTRTQYNGKVDLTTGTTYNDDHWSRKPYDGDKETIYFALHVSPAHLEDVIHEIEDFKKKCRTNTAKESAADFLNKLRGNYIQKMPKTAEGNLVYALLDGLNNLHFKKSEEVTHRERREKRE